MLSPHATPYLCSKNIQQKAMNKQQLKKVAAKGDFIFHTQWLKIFRNFSVEKAGRVVKALADYAEEGIIPEESELADLCLFLFANVDIDRDRIEQANTPRRRTPKPEPTAKSEPISEPTQKQEAKFHTEKKNNDVSNEVPKPIKTLPDDDAPTPFSQPPVFNLDEILVKNPECQSMEPDKLPLRPDFVRTTFDIFVWDIVRSNTFGGVMCFKDKNKITALPPKDAFRVLRAHIREMTETIEKSMPDKFR